MALGVLCSFIDWFHAVEIWPLADVWEIASIQSDQQTRQFFPCYVDENFH